MFATWIASCTTSARVLPLRLSNIALSIIIAVSMYFVASRTSRLYRAPVPPTGSMWSSKLEMCFWRRCQLLFPELAQPLFDRVFASNITWGCFWRSEKIRLKKCSKAYKKRIETYRKVSTIKRMNYKCFISNMNDATDTVASVKRSTCTRIVFYCSVVVAVFNFLQKLRVKERKLIISFLLFSLFAFFARLGGKFCRSSKDFTVIFKA